MWVIDMEGVSLEFFQEGFSNIVGVEDVISDPHTLEKYSKDQSFVPPRKPLLVVRPETMTEVQEIVKMANRYKVPLTPYSSGKNNQGATIPFATGVIIDLSKMDRVSEIDMENRNVAIEPGVTFARLQKEAKKHDLRVLTPIELPSSASVIATYIELCPLYSWSKYGTENMLTMELVLGNGDILRTGSSATPIIDKPYDPVAGPYGFLNKIWFGSQGTLGIVTQGIVKLKTLHDTNKAFFVSSDKIDNILRVVKDIKRARIGEEIFLANNMELALLLAENPSDVIKLRKALEPWTLVVIIRGFNEEVEFQEKDLGDIVAKYNMKLRDEIKGIESADKIILNEIEFPHGWEKTSQFKGARNVIPFITTTETIQEFNNLAYRLADKYDYPSENIGCFMLPVELGRVHYQYSFARDPGDPNETQKVKELFYELCDLLIKQGAFFSRPYGDCARLVYSRAPNYYSFIKELKKIVDPEYIMNPNRIFVI